MCSAVHKYVLRILKTVRSDKVAFNLSMDDVTGAYYYPLALLLSLQILYML